MLTSDDIKLLVDNFKTRAEADEDLRKLREELETKMQQLHLDVLEKLDAVYKELKDMRLEQTIHSQQHRDIHDEIDNLKASIHPA